MLLRGRHSLNFDLFPVLHWVIILIPVDIFTRSHHIWDISSRKGNTYLPPHSIFELPVLLLQNMHNLASLFCNFPISASVLIKLAVNIKMKRLSATLKSTPKSLTGCCSISDGENKVTPRVGWKWGPLLGVPSGSTPPSPRELERRRRQFEDWRLQGCFPGSS